jgi:hypothetical protein
MADGTAEYQKRKILFTGCRTKGYKFSDADLEENGI